MAKPKRGDNLNQVGEFIHDVSHVARRVCERRKVVPKPAAGALASCVDDHDDPILVVQSPVLKKGLVVLVGVLVAAVADEQNGLRLPALRHKHLRVDADGLQAEDRRAKQATDKDGQSRCQKGFEHICAHTYDDNTHPTPTQ